MKNLKSLFAIAIVLFTMKHSSAQNATQSIGIPESFKTSLNQMLSGYFGVMDALMEGNTLLAGAKAKELNDITASVSTFGLTQDQTASFKKQADKIQHNAQHCTENMKDYDHQCEHFDYLTDEFYALLNKFQFNDKVIYYNYTAQGNAGNSAHWLTEKSDLSNPYFKGATKPGDKQVEIFQAK